MPLPPMWERHTPGEYPAAEPRPLPQHDRRPLVLPPERPEVVDLVEEQLDPDDDPR